MSFDLGDYVDVASRIAEFEQKHPDGSLRPLNPEKPYEIVSIGERTFVVVVVAAFRTPDDPSPGVGMAWEPFPGLTPYTKNSELQNAETSAQGRAIVASLASSSKKASREEVRNRQDEQDEAPCPRCGELVAGAVSDKEPMRLHMIAMHDYTRIEDGTVSPPVPHNEPVMAT